MISLQQTPGEPWPKEQSLELASAGEICEAHWTKGLHTSFPVQDDFTGWFVGAKEKIKICSDAFTLNRC